MTIQIEPRVRGGVDGSHALHSSTHTYAILQVSPAAYREIRGLLDAAGYADQFHTCRDGDVIDMHGIAIQERVGRGSAAATITTRG